MLHYNYKLLSKRSKKKGSLIHKTRNNKNLFLLKRIQTVKKTNNLMLEMAKKKKNAILKTKRIKQSSSQ